VPPSSTRLPEKPAPVNAVRGFPIDSVARVNQNPKRARAAWWLCLDLDWGLPAVSGWTP